MRDPATEITAILDDLALLDRGPNFVLKRRAEVLRKFSWTRPRQLSILLRLGLWLKILKHEDAAENVYKFLSVLKFTGNWDLWSPTQIALIYLSTCEEARGRSGKQLLVRGLAPGFVLERLEGRLLNNQMKCFESRSDLPEFAESIMNLLEEIVSEIDILACLGGSESFPVELLAELRQRFLAELLKF